MEILWEYKSIFGNLYWTHSSINSDSPSNKHTNSIALGATGSESEIIAIIWIVKILSTKDLNSTQDLVKRIRVLRWRNCTVKILTIFVQSPLPPRRTRTRLEIWWRESESYGGGDCEKKRHVQSLGIMLASMWAR